MGTFLIACPAVINPPDEPHHVPNQDAKYRSIHLPAEQFWLGRDRAGAMIEFWADATVVHLMVNGCVPSRLNMVHLKPLALRKSCGSRSTASTGPDRPLQNDLGPVEDRTGIPTSGQP